jgi:hypothetical protein
MNQAIRAPGRVASITLLDPAGLTKLDARFWWWFSISGLATLTPMPLRRRLARWLDSPVMLERELMTLLWAGSRGYRMEPKFPGILTDDELRAIGVPALLITGARSAMLTPAEAHARGSLMPHAEVAIVPGSHGGFNRIDELNDRIAAFIQAQATGKLAAQPASPPATKPRLQGTESQDEQVPLDRVKAGEKQHMLAVNDEAAAIVREAVRSPQEFDLCPAGPADGADPSDSAGSATRRPTYFSAVA